MSRHAGEYRCSVLKPRGSPSTCSRPTRAPMRRWPPLRDGSPCTGRPGPRTDSGTRGRWASSAPTSWRCGSATSMAKGIRRSSGCRWPLRSFFRVVDAVEVLEPSLGEPPRTFPANLTRVDVCAASGDLPNAECPRTVPTWFIPGKSPIRVSTLHQALLIDDRTGLRDCPPYAAGPAHRVVYEMWSSDMARLFLEAGLPRRAPPPFDPRCEPHVAGNSTGLPPQITSPLRGVTYSLRARRLGTETIMLRATASGGVHAVYWFVGSSFIGTSAPGATVGWRPDVAGSFVVRAVDDQGQADSRMVEVAIVP